MSADCWRELGFERGGEYHIVRGEWVIARNVVDDQPKYSLYRGRECFGIFPDAHEAAVHADHVDAGLPT